VWPINRRCLLLFDTWSHLQYIQRSASCMVFHFSYLYFLQDQWDWWPFITGISHFQSFMNKHFYYKFHWLWFVPFISSGNRAHGGCDRSTGDTYFSMAPDITSDIFRGPCTPILWFEFPIGLTIDHCSLYMLIISLRYTS
jgi:hypothetical protein